MSNKDERYYYAYNSVIGRYFVYDAHDGSATVCNCSTRDDAKLVTNALNFNFKPSAYGYKLVD